MIRANLVVQTAFLGDLILTIPFFKNLKKINPDEKIILICKKGLGSFLVEKKIIDFYFEVDKGDRQSYQNILKKIQEFEIKSLYCVHRSVRSVLFSMQVNAEKKIGFRSFLGFLVFNRTFRYQTKWPDALRKFSLLGLTDQNFSDLNQAYPDGSLPKIPQDFSFQNLEPKKINPIKKIALFPGSVWATKKWTREGFVQIAQKFSAQNMQVHLLGGPDEQSLCEQIASEVPQAFVHAGKLSIAQSIDFIAECDLVVANDSAATHMAAFQNTPAVTIFGPTVLAQGFRPWSDSAVVVQNTNLTCRPCGAHGHQQCPLGHHQCMTLISADDVWQACLKVLALV